MTAGGGILHIETPPAELVESGGTFHGIQLWVNLPGKDKMIAPAYQNLEGGDVALTASADGGALLRVIAGDLGEVKGPGQHAQPDHAAARHGLARRGRRPALAAGVQRHRLRALGSGRAGVEGRPVRTGQSALFGPGDSISLRADDVQESRHPALDVIVLGGQPIREPVAQYGPFVMNTRAQLVQAVEDYQAGRLGVVPPDALMPHTR
jgi:redox-sensitive bicupin YhaK (pirin superfamily)